MFGFREHIREFAGLPVRDYDPDAPIAYPEGHAQRLSLTWEPADEQGRTFDGLLGPFLNDPRPQRVRALIIGAWENVVDSSIDSSAIIAALAEARDLLPNLRAIFLGEITREECEISWIAHGDPRPLLDAYPALEHFQIRGWGGEIERLKRLRHENLRTLIVESGGLPAGAVRAVGRSRLPRLEHLELWLGTPSYGGDSGPEDLGSILSGAAFPGLKYLGFRNSEVADRVAAALAEAPILPRLEVLDLSMGNLGDEGALALIRGGGLGGLRKLDIRHHYVSDEVLDGLQMFGIELDASDRREPDEGYGPDGRYIAVRE